jgi:hypothetical protein
MLQLVKIPNICTSSLRFIGCNQIARVRTFSFFLYLFLLGSTLLGQTWTGNLSEAWETAGNWSTNAVPGATSTVIIPSAPTGNHWPKINNDVTVQTFTMNSGSLLDVNGYSFNTTRVLTMTGATVNDSSQDSTGLFQRISIGVYSADVQTSTFNTRVSFFVENTSSSTSARNFILGGNTFNRYTHFDASGSGGFSTMYIGYATTSAGLSNDYNGELLLTTGQTTSSNKLAGRIFLECRPTKKVEFKENVRMELGSSSLTQSNADFSGPSFVLAGPDSIIFRKDFEIIRSHGAGKDDLAKFGQVYVQGNFIYQHSEVINQNLLIGTSGGSLNIFGSLEVNIIEPQGTTISSSDFEINNLIHTPINPNGKGMLFIGDVRYFDLSSSIINTDSWHLKAFRTRIYGSDIEVSSDSLNIYNRSTASTTTDPSYLDGNQFRSNVFWQQTANSTNRVFSGARHTGTALGNVYHKDFTFDGDPSTTSAHQVYFADVAGDSIVGNLNVNLVNNGGLNLGLSVGTQPLIIGGNLNINQTGATLGTTLATRRSVKVYGDLNMNINNQTVTLTPVAGSKFEVLGTFNFEGNRLNSPNMSFTRFEVMTAGGTFKTGLAAGGTVNIGPGVLSIQQSIFRNDTIDLKGVNSFEILDSEFYGHSLLVEKYNTATSFVDGCRFELPNVYWVNTRSSTSSVILSASRTTSVTNTTSIGNYYAGNLHFDTDPSLGTIAGDFRVGTAAVDSIMGSLFVTLRGTHRFIHGGRAASGKTIVQGDHNINVVTATRPEVIATSTGFIQIVGNVNWNVGNANMDINQSTVTDVIQVDGTFNLDCTGQSNPTVNLYRIKVGTRGGNVFMPNIGGMQMRNCELKNDSIYIDGISSGSFWDNTIEADDLKLIYSGGTNYFTGNNFDASTLIDLKGTATTYLYSAATTTASTSNARSNRYLGDIHFKCMGASGTQQIYLSYWVPDTVFSNVTYEQNLVSTTSATRGVIHATNSGRPFVFAGSNDQTVYNLNLAQVPLWRQTRVEKALGKVNVDAPININGTFYPINGIINTFEDKFLNFLGGAVASGTSNVSYVKGPVRKELNTSETFEAPLGDGGYYSPAKIGIGSGTGNIFLLEYHLESPISNFGFNFENPLEVISNKEYWTIDRVAGSTPGNVHLSWNSERNGATYIVEPATVFIARHDGEIWKDEGRSGQALANAPANSFIFRNGITNFSPFVLSSTDPTQLDDGLPFFTLNPASRQLCVGEVDSLIAISRDSSATLQWFLNEEPIAGANQNLLLITGSEATAGLYQCVATNSLGNSFSSVAAVTVKPTPGKDVTISGSTVLCEGEELVITANGQADLITWFKNGEEINGAIDYSLIVNEAGSYTAVLQDEILPSQFVGPADNSFGNTEDFTQASFLVFDTYTFIYLDSITVYTASASITNRTFTLKNSSGQTLASKTVSFGGVGEHRIFLGFNVPAGNNFQLGVNVLSSTSRLSRNNSGVAFPYTLNGVISIKNSNAGENIYTGFYNWRVRILGDPCEVTTDPVVVSVNVNPESSIGVGGQISQFFQLCQGDTIALTASNASGLTYQWIRNGQEILGANQSTYLASVGGVYSIQLTNSDTGCNSLSGEGEEMTVEVITKPTIVQAPGGTSVPHGFPLTLQAVFGGATSLQWYKDDEIIVGATNSIYDIPVADTLIHTGNYYVVAENQCGTTTTFSVFVNVFSAVTYFGDVNNTAKSDNICPQNNLVLTADVADTTDVVYRWYKNEDLLLGENNQRLTFVNLSEEDAADYWVIAEGPCQIDTSEFYTLTLFCPDPLLLEQPQDTALCEGESFLLAISALYSESIQWYKDGAPIPGATDTALIVNNSLPNQSGNYFAVVTNDYGSAVSSPAVVTIYPNAIVTQQPTSLTVQKLESATFTVNATGVASYQWMFNGVPIVGATGPSYTIDPVYFSNAGTYLCMLTTENGCSINSSTALLNVFLGPPPVIEEQTTEVEVCEGEEVNISLILSGPEASVTWYKDSEVLNGEQGLNIDYNPSVLSNSGSYFAFLMAADSSTTISQPITVIVRNLPVVETFPNGSGGICNGDELVLTATDNLFYQWRESGLDILGATSRNLSVSQAGSYSVVGSDVYGCESESEPFDLEVYPLPVPSFSASSLSTCTGETILLQATGAGASSYQWLKNGQPVTALGSNSTYMVSMPGIYSLKVVSEEGCANDPSTEESVGIEFYPLPVGFVNNLFGSAEICPNEAFVLNASGGNSYQWYKDSVLIPGANLANYAASQAGVYQVVALSDEGCASVLSNSFEIIIRDIPMPSVTIEALLDGCNGAITELCPGAGVSFFATPSNAGEENDISYQWSIDNVQIPGAIFSNFFVESLGLGNVIGVTLTTTHGCVSFSEEVNSNILGPVAFDPEGDCDGDGIPNNVECPNYPNCPDFDNNGIPDYLDDDDDGDGIPTCVECPNFPTDCPDTDGDGLPNYLDLDSDGDCIPDGSECLNSPDCEDSDGDGIPDYMDSDSYDTGYGDQLSIQQTGLSNVLCFGGNQGQVEFYVSGGNAPIDLVLIKNGAIVDTIEYFEALSVYQLGEVLIQTSFLDTLLEDKSPIAGVMSGLQEGTYQLIVYDIYSDNDPANCRDTIVFTITEPQEPAWSFTATDASCFGADNGVLEISFSGGTSPYQYLWSNSETTTIISDLAPGTYGVTVTDANNCTYSDSTMVGQAAQLQISAVPTAVLCFGDATGSVNLTVSGGTQPFQYTWSHDASLNSVIATGLVADAYAVTVTDANSCQAVAMAVITQPAAPLNSVLTQTPVLCFGDASGSISQTVSGGTAPYTYVWNTGALTRDISGLAAETYQVTVTDANLCTFTSEVAVSQPAEALSAAANVMGVSCLGGSDGSASLTAFGGTAPYNYLWDDNSTDSIRLGMSAQSYSATITDANDCSIVIPVTIPGALVPLSATAEAMGTTCVGETDGSILVTAVAGSGVYEYSLDGENYQSSNLFTDLSAGTYTVYVVDGPGCQVYELNIIVTAPVALTGVANAETNGTNGTATASPFGGSEPYTFLWSDGQTTQTAIDLAPDTYFCTITDANGCETIVTVVVDDCIQPEADLNVSGSQSICAGSTLLLFCINEHPSDYSYQWKLNGIDIENATNNELIVNLAGIYTLEVTNDLECSRSSSVVVNLNPLPAPPNVSPIDYCVGEENPLVDIGNPPLGFTYLWYQEPTGGTGDTAAPEVTSDVPTTFTFFVSQLNQTTNCESVRSALVVAIHPLPVATIASIINVPFPNTSTGSISINVGSGSQPYQYSWEGPNGFSASSKDITNLAPGEYFLTLTDSKGCITTLLAEVELRANDIIAEDDDFTTNPVNGFAGGVAGNVFDNDSINSLGFPPEAVFVTVLNNGGLDGFAIDPSGNAIVPPGTEAGLYTISYQICETNNPANCDTAEITILVAPAPIVAQDDTVQGVNGYEGQEQVINIFTNDTFNDSPLDLSLVTVTIGGQELTSPIALLDEQGLPAPGVVLQPNGGVDVAPGTPAGVYTITYQICEELNPTNCDTAIVTITVDPAPIVANDNTVSGVNGYDGATAVLNVLINDTLNGESAQLEEVNILVLEGATPLFMGAPVPVLNGETGNVDVPAGTPAGVYTITYQICEELNPTNCDTAIVTITVDPAPIVANDNTVSGVNGYDGATAVLNVLINDTLNGESAQLEEVNILVLEGATPLFMGAPVPVLNGETGNVDVPAGTPAGVYTITYQICEELNPTNCDTAMVTITVDPAPIVANDNTVSGVNGYDGATAVLNVLINDTLNGESAQLEEVNILVLEGATPLFMGAPVPVLNGETGNVDVPAGTPAGVYTITYQICEELNPTNCDTAIVTITVDPAPIVANDNTVSGVNGYDGATAVLNVLINDTLNGESAQLEEVNILVLEGATPLFMGAPVPVLNGETGNVDVPAGTPAGVYTITYQICEELNPTNCDTAMVTITVDPAPIVANDNTVSGVNGYDGATAVLNVLINDTLNGESAQLEEVNILVLEGATPLFMGAPVPVLNGETGNVDVPAGTPAGVYTITYQICEELNPTNCDTAIVTITVDPAPIVANDNISLEVIAPSTGGVIFATVLDNDTLNGVQPDLAEVTIALVDGITLPSGVEFDELTGAVTALPGITSGVYSFEYVICEVLNPTNCDTALVSFVVGIEAQDDPFTTNIDQPLEASVATNDNTPEGAVFTLLSGPSQGELTFNEDGTFTYVPNPSTTGIDVFTYVVCMPSPNENICDTAEVSIVIAPLAADDTEIIPFGETLMANVTDNDLFPAGSAIGLLTNVPEEDGTLVFNPDGTYTFTPTPGFTGVTTFTYHICLPSPEETICDTATVTIVVGPEAVDDNFVFESGEQPEGDLAANDTFPEGTTFAPLSGPQNGMVTVNPDGTFVYMPDADFAGIDSFTYVVCLPEPYQAVCDTATVVLLVAPNAEDDLLLTPHETPISGNVGDNDGLAPGSVFTLAEDVVVGTLDFNADGSFTYTPADDFTGVVTFTYAVCLPAPYQELCDTAEVTIVVGPRATDDQEVVAYNTSLVASVTDNDTYPEDATFAIVEEPLFGVLEFNPDGSYTYTPFDQFTGVDTFTYVVCMPAPYATLCDTAYVVLIVGPQAVDDLVVINSGETATGNVGSNDLFMPGGQFSLVTDVPAGTGELAFNPDGTFSFTPEPGFAGIVTFTYEVCQPEPYDQVCDEAVVTIIVGPSAVDDFLATNYETPLMATVAANDDFPVGSSFALVEEPASGLLVFNADGTFTFTPEEGFTGVVTFVYEVCLPEPNSEICDPATVTILVGPNAEDDQYIVQPDQELMVNLGENDDYPDGAVFTLLQPVDPAYGAWTLSPEGNLSYTPDSTFSGVFEFDYVICTSEENLTVCDTATVEIIVAPQAVDDDFNFIPGQTFEGDVTDNDVYPQGSTFSLVSQPTNGVLTFNADGTFQFIPNPGFSETDFFTYEICMPEPNSTICDVATVTLSGLNTQPDVYATNHNTLLTGSVGDNDFYPPDSEFTVNDLPSNGTLILNVDGSFSYQPDPGFTGVDTFTYQLCLPVPNEDICLIDTVLIGVGPEALDDVEFTSFGQPLNASVTANDTYAEGALFTLIENADSGTLVFNADGTYSFTPEPGFTGAVTFTYQVCSPAPFDFLCDQAQVTIYVGVFAENDMVAVAFEMPFMDSVSANDYFEPGSIFANISTPANGTLVFNADGTFTYTPDEGFTGLDSFVYVVCLPSPFETVCDTAVVYLGVSPSAEDDFYSGGFGEVIAGDASDNDVYPSDAIFANISTPANGTLVFNADGTFTYTPDEGFTGLDSFVYVVCLPSPFETVCDTAVVYLGVSPSAEDDFYSGGFGEVIAGDASDNDVYPSDAIFANISTPANGTLVFNADGTFTYTPDEGFTGLDSFVYVVCLPSPFETVCDTAVVYLGVSPSAEDDFYSGGFGEVIAGDASDNDVYPSDAIFANISTPANGTLVFNADGTFTYTPDEGFTGLDSFVYVVCLPSPFETVCDTAVVYLGVSPSAEDDFYSGGFGEVIAGDASDNDVYPSDAIFANISTPANGTLVFNADGTFTYTPDEGFTGLDSFVYVVCLPSPFETVCDTAVVYLGVSPSAEDDFYSGGFGEVIAGDASDNDAISIGCNFCQHQHACQRHLGVQCGRHVHLHTG